MHFVYRSHYAGPLSKLVRRLPDATVLDWFRRHWGRAEPRNWIANELGADVYGLSSIFEAAREHRLPPPESTDQLRTLLHEHLYVEGDADYIRLDEHSLRVRTDDDEVELAYFFLDDRVVAAAPDRLAYLLHESWPLPEDAEKDPPGEPATYATFLTYYDGASLDGADQVTFPGIELAELANHLPRASRHGWPPELHVLAALVAPGEKSLAPALHRANLWPGFSLDADAPWPDELARRDDPHAAALALVEDPVLAGGRRPEASLVQVGGHLAQLAMHCSGAFGFQQWYLFDSLWVASHPDLAASLTHYAADWDPLS
ncbi:hypothetical protein GCM10010168_27620 [Actinoplanes ianthinogenes]|uniref:Uncharacterized protein n=1 Tax=Actinoplanes ianthinogenes TaxID=122358 RepID=A0ABM7LL59_9ACTN|nr:hypothetical protein [Actinoplanes ianthinogenes]BCJ39903.1 hypothetical protein Aiant_05600 [Actinoplanes ianthinogenes]GGR08891.1 hypothetical protein GCM10010168_27620 [Actinoplanes ianthinogenes]